MVALTRIPPRAGLSGSLATLELDKVSTLSPRRKFGEFSESSLELSYHSHGGDPGDRPRISYPFSRRCAVVEKIAVPNLLRFQHHNVITTAVGDPDFSTGARPVSDLKTFDDIFHFLRKKRVGDRLTLLPEMIFHLPYERTAECFNFERLSSRGWNFSLSRDWLFYLFGFYFLLSLDWLLNRGWFKSQSRLNRK